MPAAERFVRHVAQRAALWKVVFHMKNEDDEIRCVLTIGGLDPSGGAGLTADARAIQAFGAHCCPVITAVVAQNTRGVQCVEPVSPAMLAAQLDSLLDDIAPAAIKIGMVPNRAAVEVITERLRRLCDEAARRGHELPVIIDPVFAPSRGARFVDDETIRYITAEWLPLCDIVTPNLLEAAQLCDAPIRSLDDMKAAARSISRRFGARRVLVKGGHLEREAAAEAIDFLFDSEAADSAAMMELRAPRIAGYSVRGTGCLLASALAAQRARGVPAAEAARAAKAWLTEQICDARAIGTGSRVTLGSGGMK